MDDFLGDPLGLDPLSPLPYRDPRWFVPAHGAGMSRTANPRNRETAIAQFPTWRRTQFEGDRLAGDRPLRRAS